MHGEPFSSLIDSAIQQCQLLQDFQVYKTFNCSPSHLKIFGQMYCEICPLVTCFLLFAQIHNTQVISMLCPRSRFYPSYLNQFHALKRDIVPRNTFCCKIYRFKLADSRLTRLTSVINLCAFQTGKKTTLGLFTSVTGTP